MTQSLLTSYVPIWYTSENAAKYKDTAENVSRQINIDKIRPLPRLALQVSTAEEYGEFELELLSKAKAYGLEISYLPSGLEDFAELEYLVDQYEALDEEGKFIAGQACSYHIPIKCSHLEDIITLYFEVENYDSLLDQADDLGIDWDTSTYDIDGLMEAIMEVTEAQEEDHRNYVLTISSVYRAGRGV